VIRFFFDEAGAACPATAIFGYTYGSMTRLIAFHRVVEWLLCAWVIGAQLWYLAQFRPLVEFAARKVLHRG